MSAGASNLKQDKEDEGPSTKPSKSAVPTTGASATTKDVGPLTFGGSTGSSRKFSPSELKEVTVRLEIKKPKPKNVVPGAAFDAQLIAPVRRAGEGSVPIFSKIPMVNEIDESSTGDSSRRDSHKSSPDRPSTSRSRSRRSKSRSSESRRREKSRRNYYLDEEEQRLRRRRAYLREMERRARRDQLKRSKPRSRSRSRPISERSASSSEDDRHRSRSHSRSRSKSTSSRESGRSRRRDRRRSSHDRRRDSRDRDRSDSHESPQDRVAPYPPHHYFARPPYSPFIYGLPPFRAYPPFHFHPPPFRPLPPPRMCPRGDFRRP